LLKRLLVIAAEHVITKLFIPGQIENWNIILDSKDVKFWGFPYGKMKETIGHLQSCYRSRAYRIYVVNASSFINTLWSIAQVVLDKNTIDKVNICTESHNPKMDEHINKDNIEKQYGGNIPDLTGDFWPPKCYTNSYMLPTDRVNERIVSMDTYKDYVKHKRVDENYIMPGIDAHEYHRKTQKKKSSAVPELNVPRSSERRGSKFKGEERPELVVTNNEGDGKDMMISIGSGKRKSIVHVTEIGEKRLSVIQLNNKIGPEALSGGMDHSGRATLILTGSQALEEDSNTIILPQPQPDSLSLPKLIPSKYASNYHPLLQERPIHPRSAVAVKSITPSLNIKPTPPLVPISDTEEFPGQNPTDSPHRSGKYFSSFIKPFFPKSRELNSTQQSRVSHK